MRIFCLAMVLLAFFIPAPAMAAFNGIPEGYYVGPGDGATVIFHAHPDGRATIGAVVKSAGGKWRPTPPWTGTLLSVFGPGHYLFVLGTPAHKYSYCIHSVTVTPKGLLIQPSKRYVKTPAGCRYYHGASWGYSAPVPSLLRPYKTGQ